MKSAQSAGRVLLLAVCVVCSVTQHAFADSKKDSGEYQKLVQQALREYDLGNFSEAKAFFGQAHALSPNARTLRGMGMSAYELRTYVEAIDYFEKALDSAARPLTLPMRGEVSQLLKQARSFVTRLRVKLEPASAELRIDTRAVQKDAAGFVMLDPGSHELIAEAHDYEAASRTIRTDGGEELTLSMTLRPLNEPKAEAPSEAPAPVAATQPITPAPRPAASSVGPWVLIGVSGAVAATGGVLHGLALSDKAKVEGAKSGANYVQDYKAAYERVYPMSIAAFSCIGVGVAGLIGGIAWKVASGNVSEEAEPRAELELGPGHLGVHGTF
jgi:tetratricopeptide (TPR) repeat protein